MSIYVKEWNVVLPLDDTVETYYVYDGEFSVSELNGQDYTARLVRTGMETHGAINGADQIYSVARP